MAWGFLMGAGAGLQKGASAYGRIMDEKRSQDLQIRRDELQFERQKSLKELEFQNQKKRDKSTQEFTLKRDATQRGYDEQDIETKRKFQLEDQETSKQTQIDVMEAEANMRLKVNIKQAEMLANMKKDIAKEEKDAALDEMMKSMKVDGVVTPTENAIFTAKKLDLDPRLLLRSEKGEVTGAILEQVNMIMATEKNEKMREKNPEKYLQEFKRVTDYLVSKGGPGGPQAFAQEGQPEEPEGGIALSPENQEVMAEDILRQDPEAVMSFEKLDPSTKEAVRQKVEEKSRAMEQGGQEAPVERTKEGYPVTGKTFTGALKRGASWLEKVQEKEVPTYGP